VKDPENPQILAQKSALIVEKDGQVLSLLIRWLKALDFATVTAGTPGEGLRRYKECSPFDVVLIDHPALGAVELGMAIQEKNPSQKLIFTTTCITDEDVVRPPELSHVAVLCKPFRKFQLYALLEKFTSSVREKVRQCSPRRRRAKKIRSFSVPHQDTSLIKIVPPTNAVERVSNCKAQVSPVRISLSDFLGSVSSIRVMSNFFTFGHPGRHRVTFVANLQTCFSSARMSA
jgi:DNA-binding NtrC family response regulator